MPIESAATCPSNRVRRYLSACETFKSVHCVTRCVRRVSGDRGLKELGISGVGLKTRFSRRKSLFEASHSVEGEGVNGWSTKEETRARYDTENLARARHSQRAPQKRAVRNDNFAATWNRSYLKSRIRRVTCDEISPRTSLTVASFASVI